MGWSSIDSRREVSQEEVNGLVDDNGLSSFLFSVVVAVFMT